MKKTGVILGAGIIGSAIAYELSRRNIASLAVLDADLEGSLSSSEPNAGGVRHLWNQPINRELSRLSIDFFSRHATELGFQKSGYLWLFSKEKESAANQLHQSVTAQGLSYEKLFPDEIKKKYPFLDKLDDVSLALFGSKDGLINSNALKQFFQKEAKKKACEFWDGTWVEKIEKKGNGYQVFYRKVSKDQALQQLESPQFSNSKLESIEADFVVLALGAWSKPFFSEIQLKSYSTPVRRQICFFKSEQFDMSPYGMVVDTSGVYFHPEGGNILAGFVVKEESEGFKFHMDPDFFENYIWPPLFERSSFMERLKPLNGWGGLYSYTTDTTGILGSIKDYPNLYEAHSFTGHGLMQSYGAAVCLSDLILNGKFDTIEATCLNRDRFTTGKLLPEGLHI